METLRKSPLFKNLSEQVEKLRKVVTPPRGNERPQEAGDELADLSTKKKLQPDPQTPFTPADIAALERKRVADINKAVQEGYRAGANDAWERRSHSSLRSSRSSTSSRATLSRANFRPPTVVEENEDFDQSMFGPSVANQGVEDVTNLLEQSTKKTVFRANKISRPSSVINLPPGGQGNPSGRRGSHQDPTLMGETFNVFETPKLSGGGNVSKLNLDLAANTSPDLEAQVADGEPVDQLQADAVNVDDLVAQQLDQIRSQATPNQSIAPSQQFQEGGAGSRNAGGGDVANLNDVQDDPPQPPPVSADERNLLKSDYTKAKTSATKSLTAVRRDESKESFNAVHYYNRVENSLERLQIAGGTYLTILDPADQETIGREVASRVQLLTDMLVYLRRIADQQVANNNQQLAAADQIDVDKSYVPPPQPQHQPKPQVQQPGNQVRFQTNAQVHSPPQVAKPPSDRVRNNLPAKSKFNVIPNVVVDLTNKSEADARQQIEKKKKEQEERRKKEEAEKIKLPDLNRPPPPLQHQLEQQRLADLQQQTFLQQQQQYRISDENIFDPNDLRTRYRQGPLNPTPSVASLDRGRIQGNKYVPKDPSQQKPKPSNTPRQEEQRPQSQAGPTGQGGAFHSRYGNASTYSPPASKTSNLSDQDDPNLFKGDLSGGERSGGGHFQGGGAGNGDGRQPHDGDRPPSRQGGGGGGGDPPPHRGGGQPDEDDRNQNLRMSSATRLDREPPYMPPGFDWDPPIDYRTDRVNRKHQDVKFDNTSKTVDWYKFKAAFDVAIGSKPIRSREKLFHLLTLLEGEPALIANRIAGDEYTSQAYIQVWSALESQYGGEYRQRQRLHDELRKWPKMVEFTHRNTLELTSLISQITRVFTRHNENHELDSTGTVNMSVQSILPQHEAKRYFSWIARDRLPNNLYTLYDFLESERAALAHAAVLFSAEKPSTKTFAGLDSRDPDDDEKASPSFSKGENPSEKSLSTGETTIKPKGDTQIQNSAKPCELCQGPHRLWTCPEFRASIIPVRFKFVQEKRLCFHCLNEGHRAGSCSFKKDVKCGINDCQRYHHRLLHQDKEKGLMGIEEYCRQEDLLRTEVNQESTVFSDGYTLLTSGGTPMTQFEPFLLTSFLQLVTRRGSGSPSTAAQPLPTSTQILPND